MDTCALCGCPGQHADTSAGEILDCGQIVATVPAGTAILMPGLEDGSGPDDLYCGDCARCVTPAQQLRRLITVHRLRRQQVADACGVSLSTVGSWLRPEGGRARREMPAWHLDLLRYELGL